MKKDSKIRLLFLIPLLLILVQLFCSWHLDIYVPFSIPLVGIWGILLLLYVVLDPKKTRSPDYSRILSFVGLMISFCSLGVYFSYYLGVSFNDDILFLIFLIAGVYGIFLTWYKNGVWG
ncbi:hypothetical protein MmiEs2_12510 [Methanimicrococcus stummii]|uniref:Uncharacterized protein n=1 Tax=Methanimicrococcus stummii TaxID=3028294 RepID=A0AA96V958_9EURY|nr:hypothetical protein [Methanimicrococcus sp. Es2]WNY29037.1 hypothetical protein MmiEs2_12510 [Methanimicrococcus sp. Es2]